MGTRNLVAVQLDGEYKVAQYGQWDGYPSGQGLTALEFLRNGDNVENLKRNLGKTRFIDDEKDKDFLKSYNDNAPSWSSDPDNRTPEQKRWFETYTTRNLGAEILSSIANSRDDEILLRDSISFAADSLFCEWAYVIDFDKGTFEIFKGFNKLSLEKHERFASQTGENGYHPVKLITVFMLNDLPPDQEFIDACETDE